jgi:hypothetical protein
LLLSREGVEFDKTYFAFYSFVGKSARGNEEYGGGVNVPLAA